MINGVVEDYKTLKDVLGRAYDQASAGKGKDRHANGLPFEKQPILEETRAVGIGFVAGQARKKILEATNCWREHPERAVTDLLGAINYISAQIIYIEEKNEGTIRIEPETTEIPKGSINQVLKAREKN